ncbi:slit homolog 1 protein-like [Saccostrea cucullata]|uniref:slit homolog 1 protein-like n=2 Tax=Saccostrea cuccullata TaxID=36930 RepID=UPI002ED1C10D
MEINGEDVLLIKQETNSVNKVLIISLSQHDLQYDLHITYQNKTLHIKGNAVEEWNTLRVFISVSGDTWTLNMNQTIGNTFRSYEMQGNSLFTDEYYAVFGRSHSVEFPSDQKGLEICVFLIKDAISGNILKSMWPEGVYFIDIEFSTPTYIQLLINDDNNTCRASKECSSSDCNCSSGFSGDQCEIPPNVCVPGLCKNQGHCNDTGNNSFECYCRKGFEGLYCEKETKEVCQEFQRQEDIVITCNEEFANEICTVTCKSGRVRVDKYRQYSTYMCGMSTSHKWVVLKTKYPLEDDEAPICARTGTLNSKFKNT